MINGVPRGLAPRASLTQRSCVPPCLESSILVVPTLKIDGRTQEFRRESDVRDLDAFWEACRTTFVRQSLAIFSSGEINPGAARC